ncbi:hypothetical protein CXG81DRAFT_17506 [Caulochytrium protostelioides]|uniref:Uncharacterized protein n=1 Tax=Caulochytrium protostelioides TaxID=1555241 RepID=A0A4P9XBV5_9FUNG|nr:hypothetical protein CXG81DRAFT_17506 [Caulochytrium protostelioides]|eukprot:RKP02886.1 hypothetical protein CXG81DRAFT_17506 [Caulochytrium protostelioides]
MGGPARRRSSLVDGSAATPSPVPASPIPTWAAACEERGSMTNISVWPTRLAVLPPTKVGAWSPRANPTHQTRREQTCDANDVDGGLDDLGVDGGLDQLKTGGGDDSDTGQR